MRRDSLSVSLAFFVFQQERDRVGPGPIEGVGGIPPVTERRLVRQVNRHGVLCLSITRTTMDATETARAHWRELYNKHRDKKLEWIRARNKKRTGAEKDAAYQRKWRARNKEHVRACRRRVYEKDPEKQRAKRRQRYLKDRDKIKAQYREKKEQAKREQQRGFVRIASAPPRVACGVWIAPAPPPPEPMMECETSLFQLVQGLFPSIVEVFM